MSSLLSAYLMKSEPDVLKELVAGMDWNGVRSARIARDAQGLIEAMRAAPRKTGGVESFFQTYGLSQPEGISLMCLAEALLRIPDAKTADALICDKMMRARWLQDRGDGAQDWMMRVAGFGLSATRATLESPFAKLGAPAIRKAMMQAMKILGGQFVLGQTLAQAYENGSVFAKDKKIRFSFDMLGEGARTKEDAEKYFGAYLNAIEELGELSAQSQSGTPVHERPGLSVKLSALHPRYTEAQRDLCVSDLIHKLRVLCRRAMDQNLCLTVDAEEVDRLELSLDIIRPIIEDAAFTGWDGFGLAIQAYGKRTGVLIDHLIDLAQKNKRKIQVRLVKGAYWDSEIKRAQIKGLDDYPVFTRKYHTDISYLACAQKLLRHRDIIYPMFGTHNAYAAAAIMDMAGDHDGALEFQKLYGMGDALYDQILPNTDVFVRVYAPVGVHKDLLPYLVRRLLENGANSSFVNKVFDPAILPKDLCKDLIAQGRDRDFAPHPSIPKPSDIYGSRINAAGLDLDDAPTRSFVLADMAKVFERREVVCASLIDGRAEKSGNPVDIINPADLGVRVGTAYAATSMLVDAAMRSAKTAFPAWNRTPAATRAKILNKIGDAYEAAQADILMLLVQEAGKTLADAASELREAVDFCRYYAAQGQGLFDENGCILRSYTGESNKIMLQGRGVFACISPWNFPLAIFTGQVVAALMAGNVVLAKPAEQTPFIAQLAVRLMHKAGVPKSVLHLIVGDGRVGEMITSHADIAGVAFTGSTAAARAINQTLAAKAGPIVPLVAETGGQNAIVADSSALPEQIVDDVILSAFGSAGQRCSAARILLVQDDIADRVISMLAGAMELLRVGNPALYATDIGPVIDDEALALLQKHKTKLEALGKKIAQAPLSEDMKRAGHYFAPLAYEIPTLAVLEEEVFGPILHVVRYRADELSSVLEDLKATGYGLTFGIQSRIDARSLEWAYDMPVGNVYINRSIIGAVVGVQPFGGQGLSGTGPKAGGPYYLHRFATEKVISINLAAAGGNTALVMLED